MLSSYASSSQPTASITTWFNCTGKLNHSDGFHDLSNTAITLVLRQGNSANRDRYYLACPIYFSVWCVRVFVADLPAALDFNRHPRRGALYCTFDDSE